MTANDDFKKKAALFYQAHGADKLELEKCLEQQVNADINFICAEPKSRYLKGLADFFCKKEYEEGVACQNAAGEAWASKCFNENVAFGQCTDRVLKQLYVYGIVMNKKNPQSQQQQGGAASSTK